EHGGAAGAGSRGSQGRTARSTPASTDGGGAKTRRGSRRAMESSNQAPQYALSWVLGQTAERLAANPHSTITSARSSGTRGSSRRRRIAVPAPKGRFATTLNGSRGSATRNAAP